MLKRTAKVVALDDGSRVEVVVKVSVPRGTLVRSEIDRAARIAANGIADSLRDIPYIRVGPDNTRVTV